MARREYKGAAVPTRLTAGIGAADTSFTINSSAGWPTGGANGPFTVILDPDVPGKEEVVLVNNQSAGSCTGVTRGFGDTAAVSHAIGADGSVIHGSCKQDFDDPNRHQFVTTDDDHTQYMKTDGTRHDLAARHIYGGALGTRPVPVAIGTALAAGTGAQAAAGDHVHILGAGSINSNTLFTNGSIGSGRLGVGAISAANMFAAGVVDAAAIGADQVGSSELAPGAIDDIALFGGNVRGTIVSATNPGAVGAGVMWINTTKRAILIRDSGNANWEVMNSWGPGIPYTPTLTNFSVGAGYNVARYRRHGSSVICDGFIKMGTGATTSASPFAISLPFACADTSADYPAKEFYFHAAARAFDASAAVNWAGVGVIGSGGTLPPAPGNNRTTLSFFATGGTAAWTNTIPFTWNGPDTDAFSWFCEFEPASYVDANYV